MTVWSQGEGGLLRQLSSKDNWVTGFWDAEPNYAISKLLRMYSIEEMTQLARMAPEDGDPLVIVNSMCSGMFKMGIGQKIAARSWLHAFLVWLTLLVTAKSVDSGARICLLATLKPKETYGEFVTFWLTPEQYQNYSFKVIRSEKARAL
ncbi:hypothetical protein V8F06_008193 [Rhypophila decipiens]